MTHLYRCTIELHDSLYYATREIGRLYETEPILHNYALCYALGLSIAIATPQLLPKSILIATSALSRFLNMPSI